MRAKRGSILILALWSLSLLAAFTVSLGYGVRQKAVLFDRLSAMNFIYPTAFSGIEAARGLMKVEDSTSSMDGLTDEWSQKKSLFKEIGNDRGYFSVSYSVRGEDGKPEVFYGLIDEQSKINLNSSDPNTLSRILQAAGDIDREAANELAYNIIDWRDTDSTFQHPNYGAEEDYYSHLSVPYAAKDGPFEVIDELLLVKGINRALFDKIKRFLTPFGAGAVNIHTAPREVLLALGFESRTVDKIIDYRIGEDRKERTADDRYFPQSSAIVSELEKVSALDEAEAALFNNLISAGQLNTLSTHFMVQSRGVLRKNGAYVDMEAVIDRRGKVFYMRASNIQWPSKA